MDKVVGIAFLTCIAFMGCKQVNVSHSEQDENYEAKALLQGIWLESTSEMVSFRAQGDTIFYPDSTSQPVCFRIVGDSLWLGSQRYFIVEQDNNHFCFQDYTGEEVRLMRSEEPDDSLAFTTQKPEILSLTEVVKTDSVVNYGGMRYHWYIAYNPTKYQVVRTIYNSDGVGVDNIFYDNIIHLGLFQGDRRLFSCDIKKQMFLSDVPQAFLDQAILANLQYDHVDTLGFHFNATLCIPDGSSCYLVEVLIGFEGQLTMKLMEY